MGAQDEADLTMKIVRMKTNWSIGDRYKSIQPHAVKQDLEDVFDDAVFVVNFYDTGRI